MQELRPRSTEMDLLESWLGSEESAEVQTAMMVGHEPEKREWRLALGDILSERHGSILLPEPHLERAQVGDGFEDRSHAAAFWVDQPCVERGYMVADARTESEEVLGGEGLVGENVLSERDARVEKSLDFWLPLLGECYELKEVIIRIDVFNDISNKLCREGRLGHDGYGVSVRGRSREQNVVQQRSAGSPGTPVITVPTFATCHGR